MRAPELQRRRSFEGSSSSSIGSIISSGDSNFGGAIGSNDDSANTIRGPEIEIYLDGVGNAGANLTRSNGHYRRRGHRRRQNLGTSNDDRMVIINDERRSPSPRTSGNLSTSASLSFSTSDSPRRRLRNGRLSRLHLSGGTASDGNSISRTINSFDNSNLDIADELVDSGFQESGGHQADYSEISSVSDRETMSLNAARTLQSLLEVYQNNLFLDDLPAGFFIRASDFETFSGNELADNDPVQALRVDLTRRLMNRSVPGVVFGSASHFLRSATLHPNIRTLRDRSSSIESGSREHEVLYETMISILKQYRRGICLMAGRRIDEFGHLRDEGSSVNHLGSSSFRTSNNGAANRKRPFDHTRPQDDFILGRWLSGFEDPTRLDLTYWQMVTLSLELAMLVNGMSCGFPEFFSQRGYGSIRVNIQPSSLLASGAVFEGYQIVIDRADVDKFLRCENRFSTKSYADHWKMVVRIHIVDYSRMEVHGETEAQFLSRRRQRQSGSSRSSQSIGSQCEGFKAFWRGQILDFEDYHSFLTVNSEGDCGADIAYWTFFEPFTELSVPEIVQCLESREKLKQLNERYIFMRWKIVGFSDSSREIPQGFMYCCLNRENGQIEGYIYNPSSQSVQPLLLRHAHCSADFSGKSLPNLKIR